MLDISQLILWPNETFNQPHDGHQATRGLPSLQHPVPPVGSARGIPSHVVVSHAHDVAQLVRQAELAVVAVTAGPAEGVGGTTRVRL